MSSHKTNRISILAPLNAAGKKTPTHKISPLNQQNVKYLFSQFIPSMAILITSYPDNRKISF